MNELEMRARDIDVMRDVYMSSAQREAYGRIVALSQQPSAVASNEQRRPAPLSDFYESEYPEHCRSSCSDERPINADVTGRGCLRCNAILFTRADADSAELSALRKNRAAPKPEVGV